MWAPADSCRKGTSRMPCSSSAARSGAISGDGRPKTKRTPSFARQRASSAPPFSSAIGHLPWGSGSAESIPGFADTRFLGAGKVGRGDLRNDLAAAPHLEEIRYRRKEIERVVRRERPLIL